MLDTENMGREPGGAAQQISPACTDKALRMHSGTGRVQQEQGSLG